MPLFVPSAAVLLVGSDAELVARALHSARARDPNLDRWTRRLAQIEQACTAAAAVWADTRDRELGNSATRAAAIVRSSDAMTTDEAAGALKLGPRRVRQLASFLGGEKAGGAWRFDRAAVLHEAERREGA